VGCSCICAGSSAMLLLPSTCCRSIFLSPAMYTQSITGVRSYKEIRKRRMWSVHSLPRLAQSWHEHLEVHLAKRFRTRTSQPQSGGSVKNHI
jgi:hypothetical protein